MKLRLHKNSVRLRISKSDLARLADLGLVEEAVTIVPGSVLVYALERDDRTERLQARMDGTRLTISLPPDWVREWLETPRVGFEGQQPAGHGETLQLLIEKDFECLDAKNASNPDAFPNPTAQPNAKCA